MHVCNILRKLPLKEKLLRGEKVSEENRKVEATLSPRLYQKFLDIKEKCYTDQSDEQILRLLIAEEHERIKKDEEARREYEFNAKRLFSKYEEAKANNQGCMHAL